MQRGISNFDALVAAVIHHSTNSDSYLHGERHWKAVAHAGASLAHATPQCDGTIVLLFALFHDAMRLNDDHDPQHGQRGGQLVRQLHGTHFSLSDAQLQSLDYACTHHTAGRLSGDATIAVCWDADRLNLWRVGTWPHPRYLSTPAAKELPRIEAAREYHGQNHDWSALYQRYCG